MIPLLTFLLGQLVAQRDKDRDTKKLIFRIGKKIDFELEEISEYLRNIEAIALKYKRTYSSDLLRKESHELVEYLNRAYVQIKSELDIYDFQYGNEILYHINQLKNELNYLLFLPEGSTETIFDWLEETRFLYINTMKIRLLISKNILKDSQRFDFLIDRLKDYAIRLRRLRDQIETKIARISRNLEEEIDVENHTDDIDFSYDVNTEARAIERIQKIFQEFGRQIEEI
ncbi:MAG: hypothetical protein ACTS2F_20695 [Thainema sp.]